MNKIKHIFKTIIDMLSDPMQRANNSLKDAIGALSRVEAEIKYHQRLYEFFNTQATAMNPHKLWWEFATAKDAAKHHQFEMELEQRRLDGAKARLEAAKQRVLDVRAGINSH